MIIYGELVKVSGGRLFIASVILGLLLMVIFAIVPWHQSKSNIDRS